jgi:FtsZ-interacting cell division protein ZipA
MKKEIYVLFAILFLSLDNSAFSQEQGTQNPNELVVSDIDLIIIFSGFIIAVIAIFLYLARHQILRKKLEYDKGDFESKKNRDYEKYHSDWASDEHIGKKSKSNDDEEFRKSLKNSNFPDYYKTLKIPKTATQEQIKNQFRLLVKKWHPDRNPDSASKEKMAEINKAYEVLSDKKRRKNYDKYFDVL